MAQKNIGSILIDLKAVAPEIIENLVDQEGISPDRVGDILVAHQQLDPALLSHALAVQRKLPYITAITEEMADTQLLSKIPLKFLRRHTVIPLVIEGHKYIVTSDPRDLQPLDDLALLLPGISRHAVAPQSAIVEAINRYYPLETSQSMMDELKEEDDSDINLESIEEKDIMEMANDAPIVKLVNHILYQAVKDDASDIHIEPFEKELRVRYRIDGAMQVKLTPPKRYLGAIVSRIKIMRI